MILTGDHSTDSKTLPTLFNQTFTASEGESEGQLIGKLVTQLQQTTRPGDLQTFIAQEHEQVTGAVLLTRLWYENTDLIIWMLAPVAVHPAFQGRGMGQALIEFAKSQLKNQGVAAMVTYGDIGFYSKVGFTPVPETHLPPPMPLSYPEGWLALSLNDQPIPVIQGRCKCVSAFQNEAYW